MRAHCMGNAIILAHVRFIAHGKCNSKMYHSELIRFNGHYQTLECDRMDVSGLCFGHKITGSLRLRFQEGDLISEGEQ